MSKKKKRNWLQDISLLAGAASVIFIMFQAYYAGRSIVKTSEWEKAKITIENINQFKEALSISPLSKNNVWLMGDNLWADASDPEKYDLSDTLRIVFYSLYDDKIEGLNEMIRLIEAFDAFAYPIIMGYASEPSSYQSVLRLFHTYGNFIIPEAFHDFNLSGIHFKLLYKLWRIKAEISVINFSLANFEFVSSDSYSFLRRHQLLFYNEPEITEASFKIYRKQLEKKLKEVEKEIVVFRKNSLK